MTDPVFFVATRRFTARDIADLTGAQLLDPSLGGTVIAGVAPIDEGGVDRLVFVEGKRNAQRLAGVQAAALLCTPELAAFAPPGCAVLVTDKPYKAFVSFVAALHPDAVRPSPQGTHAGVSPRANVDPTAAIEAGAVIEAGAFVGAGAEIGRSTIIAPNAVVGPGCRIGRDCYVGPGASVAHSLIGDRVIIHGGAHIGQDGFGFIPGERGLRKVPQIGRVVIQDDVEIGANSTVDRGAISDTIIGEGAKIDNLVQIAHNVSIGRHCVIAGQCGISGSVTIGDGAMLGGGVGVADHLTIGAGATVAAGSGLMRDVPAGERWGGYPAQPLKDVFRELSYIRKAVMKSKAESND